MDVVVIGGTRFVGPDIVRLLVEAGHRVSVYSRGRSRVALPESVKHVVVDRKCEGQLGEALRANRPEAVIDMIGYVVRDVQEVFAALPTLRRYVFCSSTAVYGRIGYGTPDESASMQPYDAYSQGKIDCDTYLTDQFRHQGVGFTSLRLAHPYGPRDHLLYTTGRESLFLDRMRQGRTVIAPGDGTTRIHPIFVTDAARGFLHVLDRPECVGKIYNLSGEQILTIDAYFESIARVLGVPADIHRIDHGFFREQASLWANWQRKFDFGYNWVDFQSTFDTTALQKTGFSCLTDHDTGVARTLEWLDAAGLIPSSSDGDEEDRILCSGAATCVV